MYKIIFKLRLKVTIKLRLIEIQFKGALFKLGLIEFYYYHFKLLVTDISELFKYCKFSQFS